MNPSHVPTTRDQFTSSSFARVGLIGPLGTYLSRESGRRISRSSCAPRVSQPPGAGAGQVGRHASALTGVGAQVPVTVWPRSDMVHASPSFASTQALNASGGGGGGASGRHASSPEGNILHFPRICCSCSVTVHASPTERFAHASAASVGGAGCAGGSANAIGARATRADSVTMTRAGLVISDSFRKTALRRRLPPGLPACVELLRAWEPLEAA
jgi:hypothetical protein